MKEKVTGAGESMFSHISNLEDIAALNRFAESANRLQVTISHEEALTRFSSA